MSRPLHGPVVVVGSLDDHHAAAVRDALTARDVDTVVLDATSFPERQRLSLGSSSDAIAIDGVDCGRPRAVYLRSLYLSPLAFGVDVGDEMDADWRRTLVIFREKAELLVSVLRRWEEMQVPIYNPLSASDAIRKPFQLARLQAAGLPVPDTLWTNDPQAVRGFATDRRIVYKPVAGGAATRELRAEDLVDARLARLANSPVTFQELLPGDDLRIFVLDGRAIAAYRIETEALDFRGNERSVTSVALDDDLERLCVRATETLGLRFTGMDVKAAADGRPRILELNPSPMFLGFDSRAGTDVLGKLVDALADRPIA